MARTSRIEAILWSVALPGFGQLLNGKYIKGILLIVLEFLINSKSNLNLIIISSFHGDFQATIAQTNYQWLLFYPCVYMYGIWDAYKDAGGGTKPYAVIPFAFGAFIGTIGVIFSKDFLGAIWLGLFGLCIGVLIGMGLRFILRNRSAA
ncbi:hypothetical protein E1757_32810 [Paenibacillus piri]|uniref:DUF5683 domain-containing protein n=1 Tax=Paenibacillus piri TaxID=2547395 RepID=A0A4R5KB08_9BACL|nr:hypothetical protein [Paenibacillus piri]TDF91317.1 hypothetical protein E1757_32810 [Paenibacillus piri]